MATEINKTVSPATATPKQDDFFAGQETVSSDLPRYAIGGEGENALTMIEGLYEDSRVEIIDGKKRISHQIQPREPINGAKRVLLWGNYQIDAALPVLSPGTKVRITFMGKKKIKGGRTIKEMKVEFAATAARRENPYLELISDRSDNA
jgi:hypothetical protein